MSSVEDIPIETMAKVVEDEHSEEDLLVDMEVQYKFEHYALDCWYNKSEEHNEQSNLVEASNDGKEDSTFLFAQEEKNNSQEVWYLDFGASNHMSGKNELFVELVEGVQGDVHLGDSSKLPIKRKGKIRICQRTGILQLISNVYYVANFR